MKIMVKVVLEQLLLSLFELHRLDMRILVIDKILTNQHILADFPTWKTKNQLQTIKNVFDWQEQTLLEFLRLQVSIQFLFHLKML